MYRSTRIEFYSAIDRHRKDLIATLASQLEEQRKGFEVRSKIPIRANLYDHMLWKLDQTDIDALQRNLTKFLDQTALPTDIKDKIADQQYDYSKPYSQELRNFIDRESLSRSIHTMIAAARALRNSDHVDKVEKLKLLREILLIWKQLLQVATISSPDLAKSRHTVYEDVLFITDEPREGERPEDVLADLVHSMPVTIGRQFFNDLATKRMGPLFEAVLKDEKDEVLRYFVVLQLAMSKPKDWVRVIGDYIATVKSQSFYLWAIYQDLRNDYAEGFNSPEIRQGLCTLMARVLAKHQLNISKPNAKTAKSIDEKIREAFDDKKT